MKVHGAGPTGHHQGAQGPSSSCSLPVTLIVSPNKKLEATTLATYNASRYYGFQGSEGKERGGTTLKHNNWPHVACYHGN